MVDQPQDLIQPNHMVGQPINPSEAAWRCHASQAVKRMLDVALSTLALVVLALPMCVLAVIIRLEFGSPSVFRQERPGREAKSFILYKFRTMKDVRDADGGLLPDRDRITPFGARLRKSSLDELPELYNVLKGDMSLVGPRPLLTRYTRFFTEEERLRLLVRPGITGWAQVHGRNALTWDDRLAMDVWYVKNRTLILDFKILWMTMGRVARGSGVVVDPESIMGNLDEVRSSKEEVG